MRYEYKPLPKHIADALSEALDGVPPQVMASCYAAVHVALKAQHDYNQKKWKES